MTTSSWDRSRRVATAASALTVIAVVVGAVILALGVSVPEAWWPHTGQAFATGSPVAHEDPCDLIVGPAKAYCERDTTSSATAARPSAAGAAWRLAVVGAGLAALAVWRRRSTRQQGRR